MTRGAGLLQRPVVRKLPAAPRCAPPVSGLVARVASTLLFLRSAVSRTSRFVVNTEQVETCRIPPVSLSHQKRSDVKLMFGVQVHILCEAQLSGHPALFFFLQMEGVYWLNFHTAESP